jgi:hypothetical protein
MMIRRRDMAKEEDESQTPIIFLDTYAFLSTQACMVLFPIECFP